jgi:hypothetical protein
MLYTSSVQSSLGAVIIDFGKACEPFLRGKANKQKKHAASSPAQAVNISRDCMQYESVLRPNATNMQ